MTDLMNRLPDWLWAGYFSPILSNVFMEQFEQDALNGSDIKPSLCVRYMDDILCLLKDSETKWQQFKDYLNSFCVTIKFTIKMENNNELPFFGCNG